MHTRRSLRCFFRGTALLLLGLGAAAGRCAEDAPVPPVPAQAPARDLNDSFQKGPIGLQAEVVRLGADHKPMRLPLFQVPVLRFQDRVEVSLSGEAFDPRVTESDWTLIVVFLPRTVAPTERGVVELRLKRHGDAMVAAPFSAPYDAIPMFFLVPDSGGRRKVLTDLSAHLEAFRNICLKLSDLTEQRAHADRFLAGLDSIRKDQTPASYDAAVFNFLKAYGGQVSQDFQVFLARNDASNLDKFQFLTEEFRRTNLLVPGSGGADPGLSLQGQSVSGPMRPASAYISIAFDLVQIFQNLWPGHQFQYVPALARDFDGAKAQLWYGDWIHTTGSVRGALVFCPCRWSDAATPAFTFDLPAGGSLLQPFGRVQVHLKEKSNPPFALYGHDWRLVLEGPKGLALAPLPLAPGPDGKAFLIQASPAQEALRHAGPLALQARLEGAWGFEPVTTAPVTLPAGLDPAWAPSAEERAHFMVGEACSLRLPAPWAACVGRVVFRPAAGSALEAELKLQPDGSRLAAFKPLEGSAGAGVLELLPAGAEQPARRLPLTLLPPLPVVDHVEVHQGEALLLVAGSHLQEASACVLGGQVFLPSQQTHEGWTFTCAKGPLSAEAGAVLQGELRLGDDRTLPLKDVTLLPPRPQLGMIQVIPERAATGLPVTADRPLIRPDTPLLISVLPGQKRAYPFGHKPQLRLRAGDDPSVVHPVPPKELRLVGRGQRLLANVRPSDLFGPSVAGTLEIQVVDAVAGASAWVPLQPLFLEVPDVKAVQWDKGASRLDGPALETIEAIAPSATGPWSSFTFGFQDGQESGEGPAPNADGSLFLRLYGWPDLAVRLQGPPPPKPAPAPQPPSQALAVAPVPPPQPPKAPTVAAPSAPVPPSH